MNVRVHEFCHWPFSLRATRPRFYFGFFNWLSEVWPNLEVKFMTFRYTFVLFVCMFSCLLLFCLLNLPEMVCILGRCILDGFSSFQELKWNRICFYILVLMIFTLYSFFSRWYVHGTCFYLSPWSCFFNLVVARLHCARPCARSWSSVLPKVIVFVIIYIYIIFNVCFVSKRRRLNRKIFISVWACELGNNGISYCRLRRFAFQCKAGLLMKVVCMYEHECKVSRVLSLTVFASSYTAAFLFWFLIDCLKVDEVGSKVHDFWYTFVTFICFHDFFFIVSSDFLKWFLFLDFF